MDMDDQKGLPCISRTLKVNVAVLELFQKMLIHQVIHKHLERSGLEQRPVWGAEPSSARPPGYQIDWLLTWLEQCGPILNPLKSSPSWIQRGLKSNLMISEDDFKRINKNYFKISYLITHFWMIKKRPSHGKIVISTEVYFSANHEQHLLTFLGLQNGVHPTERALR